MDKLRLEGSSNQANLCGYDCNVYINDQLVKVHALTIVGELYKPLKVILEFSPQEIDIDLKNLNATVL